MKKTIVILLIGLFLVGCSQKHYPENVSNGKIVKSGGCIGKAKR